MIVQVAGMVCAAAALWYALKGLIRLRRSPLRVTLDVVGCLVVAATALGLALWMELAGPEAVGDVAGDLASWLGDRLGVDTWADRLRAWARRRWLEALQRLQEMAGLR